MAFVVLDTGEKGSKAGQKPFLSEYIDLTTESLDGVSFKVESIRLSVKGMMLDTSEFSVFIFKSKPSYNFLLEALQVWEKAPKSKALLIKIDGEYGDFLLGLDDSIEVNWERRDKKTYVLRGKKGTSKETGSKPMKNPFLD